MASYSAVIDVRVAGLNDVQTLQERIAAVEGVIKKIKPVPAIFDQRVKTEVKEVANNLSNMVESFAKGGGKFATTVAGLNQQLSAFRTVAGNAKVGSDQFNDSLVAGEKVSRKLAQAEADRLQVLNKIYSSEQTQGRTRTTGVQEILDLGKKIPDSVAGLELYELQLRDVLKQVTIGTADFRALSQAIDDVNRRMNIATGQGPEQGPAAPQKKTAGMFTAKRMESIALGVGFPLLFGGGAGEVLGSLAGSFVGTGFGGQILGGALGGILDDFAQGARALGQALNPATADLKTLVAAIGGAGTQAGAYAQKLEALGKKQEALAVATAELENIVGKKGVQALKEFGQDSTKLGVVFVQAMTQAQASVAALINSTGILKAITATIESNVLLRQALGSEDPRQKKLIQQREAASGPAFLGANPEAYFAAEQKLIENQRLINAEKEKQYALQLQNLTAEERHAEVLKRAQELTKTLSDTYTEITQKTEKRVQQEQAAIERGLSISNARYAAEQSLNEVEKTRLERAYEYATTEQQRLDIAIALFNNAVEAARIEYQQQLESIAAEERKLQIKLQEYALEEKLIKLAADKAKIAVEGQPQAVREAAVARIDKLTNEALNTNREIVAEVGKQLEAQKLIGEYQRQSAEAQLQNKILAAQTQLEQKLVSDEIGLSKDQALQLSQRLADAANQTLFAKNNGTVLVGVIETANSRTLLLADSMGRVAIQAGNAAGQIERAIRLQAQFNSGSGGAENPQPKKAAAGAYWKGGFKAFAKGGMVNKPTLGLIGEGGQPEYIVPESKAKNFAVNYMMGARGATALNGSSGGGYAGPSSATVSIQTGPVMQMNGSNYVTTGEMVQAVQAGVERTLALIAGDQNMRRSVGIY